MQSWTRPYERQILGAMSQLSVEVRAMAEAVNSGDLEAFMARTAEDVEFTSLVAEAEGRTFRGHAGVRAWWVTVLGAFQGPRWEVLDVRESGDRAVVKSRLTATLASNALADRGRLTGHILRANASAPRLVTESGTVTDPALDSATRGWAPLPIR
jgi:ketosteroid isomerase-like protein